MSEPTPYPCIELTFDRCFCTKHGEPFRARWPAGYPIFAATCIRDLFRDAGFAHELNTLRDASPPDDRDDIALIHKLLDKRPLCCRLSPERLYRGYVESKVGFARLCQHCGQPGVGTPFKMLTPHGPTTLKHLCFTCLIYRLGSGERAS